jgi:hypothetical protein
MYCRSDFFWDILESNVTCTTQHMPMVLIMKLMWNLVVLLGSMVLALLVKLVYAYILVCPWLTDIVKFDI